MSAISEPTTRPAAVRPLRRWFQFNLQTLLVGMLLMGVLLGPVAYERQKAAREQRALDLVHELGGATNFGHDSSRSQWQRLLLGDDVPGKVSCVELGSSNVMDAHLAKLAALSQLHRLALNGSQVTDDGLVHLERLANLRYLGLDDAPITDAGLKSLAKLSALEWVSLSQTRVTNAGIQQLQRSLPNATIIGADDEEWLPVKAKAN